MDNTNKSNPNSSRTVPITVIIIIAAAALGLVLFRSNNANRQGVVTTPTIVAPAGQSTENQTAEYKDGTYQSTGDYTSPGGPEQLDVTLTIKDGVIIESEVKSLAERPNSVKFQGIFIENYKPLVIGKNIDEVRLDKVSGSSLSPKGFNDAIEKIKSQARV